MRTRAAPILISLAALALIGLLVYGVSTRAASRTLDERVALGQRPAAPDAGRSLPLLGGEGAASLASYRGQVVVLNFWASWCEPCKSEAPLLERTQRQLRRDRVTVLGVTYQDASPDSQAFVRQFHLSYPNLRDHDGTFAHSYGTDQVPETFVIDRSGHVAAITRGEITQAFLNRAIVLAERT